MQIGREQPAAIADRTSSASPVAGFSGIAYRLAALSAPRFGVLLFASALFYLA
jgi:hypothetical protein